MRVVQVLHDKQNRPNNSSDKLHHGENGSSQPKILVNWQGTDDPLSPHNFNFVKRVGATTIDAAEIHFCPQDS